MMNKDKKLLQLKLENMWLRTNSRVNVIKDASKEDPNDQNVILIDIWMENTLRDIGVCIEYAKNIRT